MDSVPNSCVLTMHGYSRMAEKHTLDGGDKIPAGEVVRQLDTAVGRRARGKSGEGVRQPVGEYRARRNPPARPLEYV